ncbi:HalD/BesD family halogenase [Sneathiella litorea]|uniref:2OG-Fe(II) oxygenase n=1 Tax=Sneathiella litorea TaxID=2606216 RepID=A0A6L8W5D2_9PROT|nr:2OG-Fe(II) oxygenase [Sneathiella litorea]MZR30308.1 2OG-Fe(II) oxygenase [Sneathiella litorea]
MMNLEKIVDFTLHPINDPAFRAACRDRLNKEGVLVLPQFATKAAIDAIFAEGEANRDKVYAKREEHTVYLSATDPAYPADHTRNRMVISSKGCITDDALPEASPLRTLYDAPEFREFLCDILGETTLYNYADPLSSVNLHYAETGQELGWHFDNSSFAITLMVQPATSGGEFEYVSALRDADAGDMNFDGVADVLDGRTAVKRLSLDAGDLVLFRGRNAMHRVTPNEGTRTRMLAVLAYNTEPGIALSKEAQMTFYGRTA